MNRMENIEGYEGLYKIDINGNVFSVKRKKYLKPWKDSRGYLLVYIYKNRNGTLCRVSRLVALTYLSNPNNYPQINHIDGIKTNNNISNLEWCSSFQNLKHAFRMGLKNHKGILHPRHKLTENQVREIRDLKGKEKLKETAKSYGLCIAGIWNVQNYKSWKHLKDNRKD